VTNSKHKKIVILLPDGISLRNFAYTQFYELGKAQGHDIIFWNGTPFDLDALGFPSAPLGLKEGNEYQAKPHWRTDILKNARKHIELTLFSKRFKDTVYFEYLFPLSYKTLKAAAKSYLVRWYARRYGSESGLSRLRERMLQQERQTQYYKSCKNWLQQEQPDMVFCASQRSVIAIAPLTAAQDLKIPTASFIFSWDNVPKATTVIESDFYFVWSSLMKDEMLKYHTYVKEAQIVITGTPQFEPHFETNRLQSKEAFYAAHHLDADTRYLCYSGDDHTTSPKDELYLRDVARAARALNSKGTSLKLIFRRCPVDFSGRYDAVLKEFDDVLIDMPPLWKKVGGGWNTILPTPEDLDLQTNLIAHTEGVINLASSMVFDYAAHGKPCAYMNYNYLNAEETAEEGVYLYDYVHFRSMPSSKSVIWMSHPDALEEGLLQLLNDGATATKEAEEWFKVINEHPAQNASTRIWEEIDKIIAACI
jgi:hypothetical protein